MEVKGLRALAARLAASSAREAGTKAAGWREAAEPDASCQCRRPCRDRLYGGVWLCRACGREID